MKIMLQDLKNGETFIEDTPVPNCGLNEILIKINRSVISLGTEKSIVQFGKSSYLQKAKQQPDKVKMVQNKIKTDGLIPTFNAVLTKLNDPMPLGYSNAGVVIETGSNVNEFKVGDRVISNGHHAEIVCINKNLVAKIPENVSDDQASFSVVSSISLQGIRVFKPTLGEYVVVIGLGLLGQITMDLLKINGCIPIGIDLDQYKVDIAKKRHHHVFNSSKENINAIIHEITNSKGVDGVIITAATKSNGPIENSVEYCRKKGRIVAVGAINMDIPRPLFYEKELEFYISTSYGPGRYDSNYEVKGVDYPLGYVRWTENRNFQAILQLLNSKTLNLEYLISKKIKFKNIDTAYKEMLSDTKAFSYLIEYNESKQTIKSNKIEFYNTKETNNSQKKSSTIIAGLIGAGNFSKVTLGPILLKSNSKIKTIVTSKGLSGTLLARKLKAEMSSTSSEDIFSDNAINTVIITTRHNSHSDLVIKALKAGKHVFVEKPLALQLSELKNIVDVYSKLEKKPNLLVGFNRRFSPLTKKVKKIFKGSESRMVINIIMNAGFIPADVWVHDPKSGGGRIIGEGCHLIDLVSAFTNSEVESIYSTALKSDVSHLTNDNVSINLKMKNGAIASIQYFSNGSKMSPKEKVFISADGKSVEIDNWRKIKGYGCSSKSLWVQDKGHNNEVNEFIDSIKNNAPSSISFESLINTTLTTFAHVQSLDEKRMINIEELIRKLII
ncbi:dehydrogenase [Candidatus Marinamargulisbacteria bacterium SCGC AG-410-N11]|nr:dehydrogenase [Candidatus Marinamargulisbacteria bacterium SCGC AG-410-N11]